MQFHRRSRGPSSNPSAVEEKMAAPDVVWKDGRFGQTSRRDAWWLSPTAVFLGSGRVSGLLPTGRRSRTAITPLGPISHRFIRPSFSAVLATRPVWPEAGVVSELSAVFSGAAHPLDPGPLPPDLLLLPRRLLQVVLGRSSGVRGERAAQELSRRTKLSADPAEFSSLLSAALLPGVGLSGLRRSEVVPFSRTASGSGLEASFWS